MPDPEHEGDYHVISKDAVPIPELPLNSSWQSQIGAPQQWLQPTDYNSPGNEFMKHLHSHVPGTGSWARESPTFMSWAQGPVNTEQIKGEGTLHVRGVAGSGKSVFAATTIRQLQESEPTAPVLFFFFRQIVEKHHGAKYLVRDFTSQLLPHS